jgi:hypothetical protein
VLLYVSDPAGPRSEKPVDLSFLDQFQPDDLYMVSILATQVSAEELSRVKRQTDLKSFSISELRRVTSDDLAPLKDLTSIDSLAISGSGVTDEIVSALSDLPKPRRVKQLGLSDTQLTDRGIESIRRFRALRVLTAGWHC